MDNATLGGSVVGVGLIIGSILIGSPLSLFFNAPGLLIVIGGTLAATCMTFQIKDVQAAVKAAGIVFSSDKHDWNEMVATMVELCTISRRQGLVALSKLSFDNRFLKKACQLISDGTKEDLIRDTLQIEIEAMRQRHSIVQDVFKKMGSYAPAFGMIGTLIGLVQMLNGLDDPSSVGPSMAVALLTTFYGSVYAFMFMNPLAGKLQARTAIEIVNLEIMFEGAASIVQENNPMVVYEKLSSFIPTTLRKPMDEKRGKGK